MNLATAPGLSQLSIDGLRIYRFDIPLKDVFTIATMSLRTAQNILVEVRTNQGLTGWGEASPLRAIVGETQSMNLAAAQEMKPLLMGKNPLALRPLLEQLEAHLPHNNTLRSAIDMALFDVAAQACHLPLYAFLGGKKRELESDFTLGICDPDRISERAQAIQAQGFQIIKVRLGLNDQDDYRRLVNVRRAVGPTTVLRIDANQGWDRMAAVHNLRAFEELNIQFCEQPCRARDLKGMRFLTRHANIPVMADESLFSASDALEIIQEDAAAYFNLKLSQSGGLLNAQKIVHLAEVGFRPCMMGCMSESRLGITAAAHFASAHSLIRFFDLDSCLKHAENRIVGGIEYQGGTISLPDTPGIGALPDPDYVRTLEEV